MRLELRPRGLDEVKIYFEKASNPEIAAMLPRGADSLEEADLCRGRNKVLLSAEKRPIVFGKGS